MISRKNRHVSGQIYIYIYIYKYIYIVSGNMHYFLKDMHDFWKSMHEHIENMKNIKYRNTQIIKNHIKIMLN